jgi:hypothetical protein
LRLLDDDLRDLELEALRRLRLAPKVFGRPADGPFDVDVVYEKLLDERPRPGDDVALGIDDDAVAVEDKLVLAAYGVDPGDPRPVVAGAAGDHRLARGSLPVVVRRAVDVDEHLGAVVGLPGHRSRGEPAVLAHRQAEARARELEDRGAVALSEVALLVEHAVVG